MIDKICKNCQKRFITNRNKIQYCSHICFLKSPINTILKCGESNVSKRPEVRKKMSLARIGKFNEFVWNYKGKKVGYEALHGWVKRHYGFPLQCEFCGTTDKKLTWANKTGKYLRKRTDWMRLCYSCHKKYDLKLKSIRRLKPPKRR